MAAKQARSGSELYLEFDSVVIDPDFKTFDADIREMVVDSTAGADALVSQHTIRESVAPKLRMLIEDSAGGIAIQAVLYVGNQANLVWGYEGNGTGKPKWGIEARITRANIVAEYDGVQELEIEFVNVARNWLHDGRSATFS